MDSTACGGRPRSRFLQDAKDPHILGAALDLLAEVGYDRLTMDGVAARARAGKATLYRRWGSKAELVVDAIATLEDACPEVPPTGSLRGDLLAHLRGKRTVIDDRTLSLVTGVLGAAHRDRQLGEAFAQRVSGPRRAQLVGLFELARARGEVREDVDLDLVVELIPACFVFSVMTTGRPPEDDVVERLVDQVVLRAVSPRPD